MSLLAETLDEAIAACSGEEPLEPGDQRYLDLSGARGEASRTVIQRRLTARPPGARFEKIMFFSHRGAGKSTELLRLQGDLEAAHRYRVLYLEANVEMDPHVIEAEDLFLALARAVDQFMRGLGLPLPEASLERVTSWFKDVVGTTTWGQSVGLEKGLALSAGVDAKGGKIPLLGSLLATVNGIMKFESEYRVEVRQAFRRFPGALLDAVNQLLRAADQLLQFHGHGELLVVIDNFDRYPPDVVDKLLVQGAERIGELRCSLVVTPPISLHYRPRTTALRELYTCEVMPAVRLRRPEDPYDALDGPGRDLLLQALSRRIHLRLIPDEAARDRLVVASGGAMRDLLRLFAEAALRSTGEVVTLADVRTAVKLRIATLRDQVNANGWAPTLAGISRRKQIDDDDACQHVLYHRLALKYDGDGWYDVHPLVAELDEFRKERAKLSPILAS